MTILTSADYPTIRAAIDVTLDAATLPDSVISLSIYVGAGQSDVIRQDALAETRTDPVEVQHVKNAAIYFTAARLVAAVPLLEREQMTDYSYSRKQRTVAEMVAALLTLAESELAAVLTPTIVDGTANRPTFFTVATGRRGR